MTLDFILDTYQKLDICYKSENLEGEIHTILAPFLEYHAAYEKQKQGPFHLGYADAFVCTVLKSVSGHDEDSIICASEVMNYVSKLRDIYYALDIAVGTGVL